MVFNEMRVLQIINEVNKVGKYHENSDDHADKVENRADRLR